VSDSEEESTTADPQELTAAVRNFSLNCLGVFTKRDEVQFGVSEQRKGAALLDGESDGLRPPVKPEEKVSDIMEDQNRVSLAWLRG
jgi:hypothetical protein